MKQLDQLKHEIFSFVEPRLAPLLERASERWEELSQREQWIVSALGATLALALVFALIIYPLVQAREQAKTLYESKVSTLNWMEKAAPQAKAKSSGKSAGLNAQSMMQTVNQYAAAYQLSLDRVQPEGGNRLRVWIQSASFNAIVSWMNDLQNEAGIIASSVSIDNESRPGMASAKLVLEGL